MLSTFSLWLERSARGRIVLLALAVFLLFTALVLPAQAAAASRTAAGAGSPDMSFSYSSRDLYRMAEAYGAQGRAAYIRARFTFDLLWPLVYTFFLASAISWLLRGVQPAQLRLLNLLPVLGAFFDYLENLSTSLVMLRYPQPTPILDHLAPLFTLVKWILVYGSFVVLLAGAVAAVARALKARSQPA